jgi:hypothetical protein
MAALMPIPWRSISLTLALASLLLPACAALGTRTEGQAEAVSWRATDLRLERRPSANGINQWFYTFNLVVHESRGTSLTFEDIVMTIYQPGVGPWTGRYKGSWPLAAGDEFRIPLQSTISCASGYSCLGTNVPTPLWRITLSGKDGEARPVKSVIDITLPADPPDTPAHTSQNVRPIGLR